MATELKVNVETLTGTQNQFTTVQAILDLLPTKLRVSLEDTEIFVNTGSNTPPVENRQRPWFRFAANGDFIGVYIYMAGDWELAPSLPIGSLIRLRDIDTTNLPAGFVLANGSNNSVDLSDEFEPVYSVSQTQYDHGWLEWVGLANA